MTLNKYIYDIRSLLRNHNIIDEDTLTDRQIEFWIISQRSLWINRRDDAYIEKNHSLRQTLVDGVEILDRSFEPGLVTAGYKILRNDTDLPKPVAFKTHGGIIETGPIDMGSYRFNHVEYNEAIYSGNGRFNRDMIYTYYKDKRVYIISRSLDNKWYLLDNMAITGIWEDPRAVENFKHVSGDACWTADDDYPVSLDIWEYMKDMIKRGNIDTLVNIPVDKGNDDMFVQVDKP
jgi:hypothetical protein